MVPWVRQRRNGLLYKLKWISRANRIPRPEGSVEYKDKFESEREVRNCSQTSPAPLSKVDEIGTMLDALDIGLG